MDVHTDAVTGVIALDRHGREVCSTTWDKARGRRWVAQDVDALRAQLALREALPPWPYTLHTVAGEAAGGPRREGMTPVRARTLTYQSTAPATDLLGEQGAVLESLLRWLDNQPRHALRTAALSVPDVLLTRWKLNQIADEHRRSHVVQLAQRLAQRAVRGELIPGLAVLTQAAALLDVAPRALVDEIVGVYGNGLAAELLYTNPTTPKTEVIDMSTSTETNTTAALPGQILDELAEIGLEATDDAEAAVLATTWPARPAGEIAAVIDSERSLRLGETGEPWSLRPGDEVVSASDVIAAQSTLGARSEFTAGALR